MTKLLSVFCGPKGCFIGAVGVSVFLPDFLQTRKNGGFLRKNAVLFELWGGSNQLWPKRVEMSAIPCGAWVSGISQSGLKNPAVIIDTNHSNSGKKYYEQPRIVDEVLHSRLVNPAIAELVKGVMVESYLLPGNQKVNEHEYGKSITDPCLGWDETERLIDKIASHL